MKQIEKTINTEFFNCECHCSEHVLRFIFFEDAITYPDGSHEEWHDYGIYADVFLEDVSFFKRLWRGIRYIFGHKCKYGHFGCWCMNVNETNKLRALLDRFEECAKENEKQKLHKE